MRLFEGVQLAFGPTTGTGFYYDFRLEHPLSEEDFPRIEAEMQKIIKADDHAGYPVAAETGRTEAHGYLHELGAASIVARATLEEPGGPLGSARWSGAIDTRVGPSWRGCCARWRTGRVWRRAATRGGWR